MKPWTRGFTIVELLIVIVVIGILAAISIVAYTGIQRSARVSTAKAELSNIAKQLEVYRAENGNYPTAADNVAWGSILRNAIGDLKQPTQKRFIVCRFSSGAGYGVIAWNPINPLSTGDPTHYVSSSSSAPTSIEWVTPASGAGTGGPACSLIQQGGGVFTWSEHDVFQPSN